MFKRFMTGKGGSELSSILLGRDVPSAIATWTPRWNIEAGSEAPVLRTNPASHELVIDTMAWGFSLGPDRMATKTIAAQQTHLLAPDTPLNKAFLGRRGVIPATGLWLDGKVDAPRIAALKGARSGSAERAPIMYLAGVWTARRLGGDGPRDIPGSGTDSGGQPVLREFAMVVTEPDPGLLGLISTFPVILAREDLPFWLGEVPATPGDLLSMIYPYPAAALDVWPIGPGAPWSETVLRA